MINSWYVFEVMSSYKYFAAMLLGFVGLLSLVELEGFRPGSLIYANGIERVLVDFYRG